MYEYTYEMLHNKMSDIVDNFATSLQSQLFEITNMSFSLVSLST